MRWIIVACFLACATPAVGHAQENGQAQPSTLQLARTLVDIGSPESDYVDAAIASIRVRLASSNIEFSAAQWERLTPRLRELFAPGAQAYSDSLAQEIAANCGDADLQAAIAYYSSPPGQRYTSVVKSWLLATSLLVVSRGNLETLPAAFEQRPGARLDAARALAQTMSERLTALEREQFAESAITVEVYAEALARYLANQMEVADLVAAHEWARSPASQRIEGAHAWRAQAAQLAATRSYRAIDFNAIDQALAEGLSDGPTSSSKL